MLRMALVLMSFSVLSSCAVLKDIVRPPRVEFPAPPERDAQMEQRAMAALRARMGEDWVNGGSGGKVVAVLPRSSWSPERNALGFEIGRWRYFTIVLHSEFWKGELGECQYKTASLGEERLESGYADQMYFIGWPMESPDEFGSSGAFDCAQFPEAVASR